MHEIRRAFEIQVEDRISFVHEQGIAPASDSSVHSIYPYQRFIRILPNITANSLIVGVTIPHVYKGQSIVTKSLR